MGGVNKAILIGNIGQDPELKFTSGGQGVLKLRVATSEHWVDKQGEKQERTEWHSVSLWGKRAEALNKILRKGWTVYVEGRIQTRNWEAEDGSKRYATEINAQNLEIVKGDGSGGARDGGSRGHAPHVENLADDDIPF